MSQCWKIPTAYHLKRHWTHKPPPSLAEYPASVLRAFRDREVVMNLILGVRPVPGFARILGEHADFVWVIPLQESIFSLATPSHSFVRVTRISLFRVSISLKWSVINMCSSQRMLGKSIQSSLIDKQIRSNETVESFSWRALTRKTLKTQLSARTSEHEWLCTWRKSKQRCQSYPCLLQHTLVSLPCLYHCRLRMDRERGSAKTTVRIDGFEPLSNWREREREHGQILRASKKIDIIIRSVYPFRLLCDISRWSHSKKRRAPTSERQRFERWTDRKQEREREREREKTIR